ncbi:MAG: demethylmenaquinone methyltransferase [Alicyclobacillus herbarius]|uniref:demethylmenaquinone methyltransferase n=1 Tax=Alicyclobacillus herbarius TaxID=122960 RepID=UPI0003FA7333|nr:demethylmenaquinone methyltransferase [Alicyclobacillus herbarius]MCL6631314.1 demethylmenaquinone methyltransferase [Alicyclobacillus herbarius]
MAVRTDKARYVHDVFSQIARQYDVMNTVLSFFQHKLWRRFAMKKLGLSPGSRALDVACGTGDWTFALARTVGGKGEVVGIDFCKEMLDVAKEKLRRHPEFSGFVRLLQGDAMALPFASDSFDSVTIGFALRNVPDIRQVLSEMTRVARPGGWVVSLELSKPEWPIWRSLYYFYFYRILPWIGALAVGKRAPYAWLPESLTDFPDRRQLEQIFREVGLTEVRSYPLTGGIAALHMGRKAGG